MKTELFVFVAFLAAAQAIAMLDLDRAEWSDFKNEHGKKYTSETEDKHRMEIFMENKHKIAEHNRKHVSGEVSYKQKINKYADMTHYEFIKTVNGFKKPSVENSVGATFISPANVELPSAVDWRNSGAVTSVKDQGQCGSCWAFSATGALEGQHFRHYGDIVSLSEQNLVDCSRNFGNHGCGGGSMVAAFQYIKFRKGIDTEESYPYEGRNGRCRYNPNNIGAKVVGYVAIPKGHEEKLKAAVATVGPVAIAIDASHQSFQFYSEGVYTEPKCSSSRLDHGVLAVGYGTDEEGVDYWLVKNSWGDSWGEDGYLKMIRNKGNRCGVATQASYPLV